MGERNTIHTEHDAFELSAWKPLTTSTKVFFPVLILLYEISVAFHIFKGEPPLFDDFKNLRSFDLEKLAVWKEAADEVILANYVDRKGLYLGPKATKSPPWFRCNTQLEMIQVLFE